MATRTVDDLKRERDGHLEYGKVQSKEILDMLKDRAYPSVILTVRGDLTWGVRRG